MKILYSCPAYLPAYRHGGLVTAISAMAEELVRRGHELTVVTTTANLDQDLDVPTNRPLDVNGVTTWYFERQEPIKKYLPFLPYLSQSTGLCYSPQMKAALPQLLPQMDVVNTHSPYIYPSFVTGRMAHRYKKPLFFHQHGDFSPMRLAYRGRKKRLYIKYLEKPILSRATTLIALAQAELESYRALGFSAPIKIIPNGIHPERFWKMPRVDLEQAYGLPGKSTVILFMGRLHVLKGAERLLKAFLSVQHLIPDSVLIMAGPDEHQLQAQYQKQVQELGLEHRVIFPGMVTGEEKLNLLASADLFCLPSDAEGFSMAVLEAMASQTALLLSPGCNFPEVAQAGAGVIVDTNEEAIAQALIENVSAPEQLCKMGEAALDLVTRDYTWSRIAQQLEEAYMEGYERYHASSKSFAPVTG